MNFKVFLLLFFFTGCQTFGQSPSEKSLTTFRSGAKTPAAFQAKEFQQFGELKWRFKTGGKIFSSPAVVNNVAYVGSEDMHLYAIDIVSGRTIWSFKTGGQVSSTPLVYKQLVYFGSFDGFYYAIDLKTGKQKWKFKTGGEKRVGGRGLWTMKPANQYMEDQYDFFLSSPIINRDEKDPTVYFGSSDGNLYAVNANTGKLKWKFKSDGIIHTSPALYKGKVYFGSWDMFVYALDAATGEEKWKFKTGADPQYHVLEGIQASPVISNGAVYIGARDGFFYALDAETGSLNWKYAADNSWIITTAAVKDKTIFIGTSDSFLFLALDAETGKEKFRTKTHGYNYSSAAIAGSVAFYGDFTGKLYALDINEGKVVDQFETPGRKEFASAVLNKDGILDFKHLAAGKDPTLYQTGVDVMKELYKLGPIVSSPVVLGNTVYFGSADGYLYAINLKEKDQRTL